jgi:hypothetical protein
MHGKLYEKRMEKWKIDHKNARENQTEKKNRKKTKGDGRATRINQRKTKGARKKSNMNQSLSTNCLRKI